MKRLRRFWWLCLLAGFVMSSGTASLAQTSKQPIIDMHIHAVPANFNGPPPVKFCSGDFVYPAVDPQQPFGLADLLDCANPLMSAATDTELMEKSLAALERYNIVAAVVSGPLPHVRKWQEADPARVIPALMFSITEDMTPQRLREMIQKGDIKILGELLTQYQGYSPSDPELDPYFAVAEEFDIPVAIHMGMGPPGVSYLRPTKFRAKLTNPLLLEETLLRHPKMRVYVQHAGWPMLDEIIHLLYSHPQVYVDVGIISWGIPRKEFHFYLRRMVEAGLGKRILFGTDQIVWPDSIGIAIEAIETADFLSEGQKRDIFYNNAARFLRLDAAGVSTSTR